ncbi:cell differentiation protein [Cyclospora cayetanensis]|uniref:Cell differentiation protein n=1 Tax=Cyclospora cayetanensis TaxID=88456 RepID=A0A1D3CUW8_9EIME|nr:cell differentiation protein [Cyclospora cayetanensis]
MLPSVLLVLDLSVSSKREFALLELSKRREAFADLAPLLWHSFGTMAAILQEIISAYPFLSPPSLTTQASNRVCNSLALLQCVASHPDTRQLLLNAHIPLFLYPFLNTVSKTRPFEYLRLTSLGVIGAIVKADEPPVVSFLLQTEIIPLCLRIMETGSELSKTVATFIVQKVLLDDLGLSYICATAERFYAVSTVLCNMVTSAVDAPSSRLLKHVVRCYLRLSDNSRAREALRQCLPEALKCVDIRFYFTIAATTAAVDASLLLCTSFVEGQQQQSGETDGWAALSAMRGRRKPELHANLKDDPATKKWLLQLLHAVSDQPLQQQASALPQS